jgi:ADP-dependent NAD(P)H-hydrate dehydratase / NAD(P)H-hydrate epimerase
MSKIDSPDFWQVLLPQKTPAKHKYDYGHVVVLAGARLTGAASLAAIASLRMGAGACTIVSHADVMNAYRAVSPSVMVEQLHEVARFKDHLKDPRRNTVVIGPGAGHDNIPALKKAVLDVCQLTPRRFCIVDADALTAFADDPMVLASALNDQCVITPHEGELKRLFPHLYIDEAFSKKDRAVYAAQKLHAIVVLKGDPTIIAHPDGSCVEMTLDAPWLATAGSGDVLAGMIAGLAAWDSMPLFDVCCASVGLHAHAARAFGPALISADLPDMIPSVWEECTDV